MKKKILARICSFALMAGLVFSGMSSDTFLEAATIDGETLSQTDVQEAVSAEVSFPEAEETEETGDTIREEENSSETAPAADEDIVRVRFTDAVPRDECGKERCICAGGNQVHGKVSEPLYISV